MKQEIARESLRGHSKLQVSSLPFSEIPHQSRLFLEYQSDPASLKEFYPNAVTSPLQIRSFIPEVLANYKTDRQELCEALTEINSQINAGEKTFEAIKLLGDRDTVAVVTGQQAGLFTGPLYTIYKALSAIKLAEELNNEGTKAIAVFWAATEDHDFDEVSEASLIRRSGEVVRSTYSPEGYVKNIPVGSVEIDGEIDNVIEQIFAELPDTEFSAEVEELLRTSWSHGTLFGNAFEKTLAVILGKFGMIFIDPMNERIKRLSSQIYVNALAKSSEIVASVIKRSRELENKGYHAQVLVEEDHRPLFWHDDAGRRAALRKVGQDIYRAKGDKREFTLSELEKTAADEPRRFSPGVMLRPVVQDHLLPTVCYFGGAAEIAYFAQNSEVYRVLRRPVTPILHRQSFTIVEPKYRRMLDKLGLQFPQLFDGLETTRLRLATQSISPETATLFASVEETINTELNRLDQRLSRIDTTLAENLAKRRRKMIYHIAALRKKTLLAFARKDETSGRQLENVFAALLPGGELQERSLNVINFLNRYGSNFVDWIYESIDLEDTGHRIVDL
ncbi:MAG: bacillithiol biosynthesis cysteine-adding enzyme BshC [Acidobacteriota bacterium]